MTMKNVQTGQSCDSKDSLDESEIQVGERIWTTVVATLVVSIMGFMMGCTLGYPSPVLLELQSEEDPELRFDSLLSGLFGASALVGGIFGGPVAGWVADKWGRKISLMLCGLPYLFGYFLIVSASITTSPITFKALLLSGRFITGVGIGWAALATAVYIGETSSAKLRGILATISNVFLAGGVLFVYAIGIIPIFQYYHIALVLEGVILLYTFLVVWIPETPRWLLIKDKKEWAEKVLIFLRGPKAKNKIKNEIDDIEMTISKTPHLTRLQTLKEFRRMCVLVPVILAASILIIQEFIGIGAVNTYSAPIFKEAGVNNPDLVAAFAVGGAQLVTTVVTAFIVDLLGRKVLLIVSAAGMFAGTAMLGAHFYITRPALCANSTNVTGSIVPLVDSAAQGCNSQYAPLAIASLALFSVAFAIGWGPVPWVILSEYLPLQVRGIASGICVMCAWSSAAVVTGIYPIYAELVNPWFAWWTFSIVNLIAIVFVAVFVVETKGKSLEDIQSHFEQKHGKSESLHSLEKSYRCDSPIVLSKRTVSTRPAGALET